MKRTRLVFPLFFLALLSCSSPNPCRVPQNSSCTKVLFIGNSYTFVNDLPEMFAELAEAGQHPVMVGSSAQGGWSLAMHTQSKDTVDLLNSTKWTYVILQEQSQIPSVETLRTQKMYPAARTLVKQIRKKEATPLFFLTWAHRTGWPAYGMNDYESMQERIDQGYEQIARELNVSLVPVGYAWRNAIKQYPELTLWQEDGSHPSEEGTYLAACVFYATLFQESPVGISYWADLPKETAARLQTSASDTVLGTH